MSRYYFHLHNDIHAEDHEGREVPDPAAAREIAMDYARDMVCANIHEHGNVNLDHFIQVTDGNGQDVMTVTFREAFTIIQ